ncbi:bifunctional DNA primase/polymerase [Phlyctochytrium arcticum]|nr:bifunctional DNA primase/polymerase [Phlyctochytrium arcticum]
MVQSELFKIAKKMHATNMAFVPIPASLKRKRPIGHWSPGKYSFAQNFQKREKLESECNLGLIITSQYMVLDIDNKTPATASKTKNYSEKTGVEDFNTLIAENENLPATLTVTTPSGGRHYYFKMTGCEEEAQLKNWTCCMSLNNKLIAVDVRKQGGYVMCPPSIKGVTSYTWDDAVDQYRVEMAPLPRWILRNILSTMKKDEKHLKSQEFTSSPVDNAVLTSADVQLFMESEYYLTQFQIDKTPNRDNIYRITSTAPYMCKVCGRLHSKNTNHPFLVRNNGTLRFVCRSGTGNNVVLDKNYMTMWDSFEDKLSKSFVEKGDCSNQAISKILYAMTKDVVYPNNIHNTWTHYNPEIGIWQEQHYSYILRPFFDKLATSFAKLHYICSQLSKENAESDPETAELWKYRTNVAKLAEADMKKTREKKDNISALFELNSDRRIIEKFNSKAGNLHCSNGVYDLDKGEWRDAKPEDFSTMSTHLKYVKYSDHPQEKKDIINKFLDDFTLGRSKMKSYLLKALAIFGDYSAPISSALVSKPNINAQSASPALVALKHIRSGILTELEHKSLYTEFLKMIVCGDKTTARQLYEGGMQPITLAVKPFIMLNKLPNVLDTTYGFWRKMVVFPCEARFKAVVDPTQSNEKNIIAGFDKELLACADTFLALLIDVYQNEYKKEGIKEDVQPDIIKETTKNYQLSQNIALAFEQNMLEKTDKKDVLTITEMNEEFRKYCMNAGVQYSQQLVGQVHDWMDTLSPPTNKTRQMKKNGQNVKGWKGYRIKTTMVDISADNSDSE